MDAAAQPTGLVSQIQHGSTGDGPGLRTTVFLAGCNLRCAWCHNPETQSARPRPMLFAARCAGCRICETVCRQGTHVFFDGAHTLDPAKCTGCGACVRLCPSDALRLSARRMTLPEVLAAVDEDLAFYRASGGGVTLSGGEPLLQPAFCAAVATACRERGVSVLLDTAGDVPRASLAQLLPLTDEVYYDLKTADAADCARYVGGDYDNILANLRFALERHPAVTVRIPLIPGVSAAPDKLAVMADRLEALGARRVSLIPFHRLGGAKYEAIGRSYAYRQTPPLPQEAAEEAARYFVGRGFAAALGG